jgi:hypothetical protein
MLVLLCRERERERDDVWCLFLSVIFSSFCCIIWMAERENEWVLADIYLGVMTMEVSGERAGNMDSGSVFLSLNYYCGIAWPGLLSFWATSRMIMTQTKKKMMMCARVLKARTRNFYYPPLPGPRQNLVLVDDDDDDDGHRRQLAAPFHLTTTSSILLTWTLRIQGCSWPPFFLFYFHFF